MSGQRGGRKRREARQTNVPALSSFVQSDFLVPSVLQAASSRDKFHQASGLKKGAELNFISSRALLARLASSTGENNATLAHICLSHFFFRQNESEPTGNTKGKHNRLPVACQICPRAILDRRPSEGSTNLSSKLAPAELPFALTRYSLAPAPRDFARYLSEHLRRARRALNVGCKCSPRQSRSGEEFKVEAFKTLIGHCTIVPLESIQNQSVAGSMIGRVSL